MTTQRIWRRVEAPGTFRGHALVADLHGSSWYAWEDRDGTWAARRDGTNMVRFPSWTELRTTVERAPNPRRGDPRHRGAAERAARTHFDRLRERQTQEAVARARQLLGPVLLATGPSSNGIWVTVRKGHGRLAYARFVATRFPLDVKIMEER